MTGPHDWNKKIHREQKEHTDTSEVKAAGGFNCCMNDDAKQCNEL